MKQIPESIKQQAIALRQQGLSYAEISTKLNISVDWCKRNLKVVKQAEKQKFEQLYTKGKSNRGVSRTEVFNELELAQQDEKDHNKLMTSAVKRIRANNKENIVRPDWMLPTAARFCTDSIVNLSMDIEDRCHEEAYSLHKQLQALDTKEPIPSVLKIKTAILSLSFAAVNPNKTGAQKLSNWLDSLYKAANALEQRNTQSEVKSIAKSTASNFDDLEHLMY